MSSVVVRGIGAVSPAGWGVGTLREALQKGTRAPHKELPCPAHPWPLRALGVPPLAPRPGFAAHARLRRASPIGHYAVGAALEALGDAPHAATKGAGRLGIVYCAMSGCVNFSRRFYDETLKDPPTASPVIFPETVFNAPASHLGALLRSAAINYTLVGDPGTFLQGLALGADWLLNDRVDGCLVIGAEELDWLVAEAFGLFNPGGVVSEGAGALYLRRGPDPQALAQLEAITDPQIFFTKSQRARAAMQARTQLGQGERAHLLCDGLQGVPRLDRDEGEAWKDWPGARCSPKQVCGEAFAAAAGWQCVSAVDALNRGEFQSANVSVVGCSQQAIAARFGRS